MKKLFSKSSVSTLDHSTFDQVSHRAQVVWSLFVAIAVAAVALQQVRANHNSSTSTHRSPATAQTQAPRTLVTSKPVPLSQDDLALPETQLQ
jgi:hypothetical protein